MSPGLDRGWVARRSGLSILACASLLASLCSTGCVTSVSPQLHAVKSDFEEELEGSRFEPETTFHLGRISLGLARSVLSFASDVEEERELLRSITRVDVGIFRATDVPDELRPEMPQRLERFFDREGWVPVVRIREPGASTWVYYQADDRAIRGLYVVFLDDEELGLIRLQGRLDRAFAVAMASSRSWADGTEPF